MTERILAYLMDDLSPAERAEVEVRLTDDPAWQAEFERLRDCLAGCGGDCDDVPAAAVEAAPPSDLARRTCSQVESGVYQRVALGGDTSQICCGRSRWQFADLAVAAGVVLALGSLMLPAVVESREAARRTACQQNLGELGRAFLAFADRHGKELPPLAPGQNAGMYAVYLADQTGMSREQLSQLLVCPASRLADDVAAGRVRVVIPTREQLHAAQGPALLALRQFMGGDYAYRFGFFDPQGKLHQVEFIGDDQLPVLADAPEITPTGFRNMRHGASGGHVLYQNMTVRFVVGSTTPAGDDLFTNLAGQQAAGLDRDDVVLGLSGFEPLGTNFIFSMDE